MSAGQHCGASIEKTVVSLFVDCPSLIAYYFFSLFADQLPKSVNLPPGAECQDRCFELTGVSVGLSMVKFSAYAAAADKKLATRIYSTDNPLQVE